jgi:phosphatidylserine/phosphatidylglycerophosphate/cardiolipin synthase-like enzyme
MAGNSVNKLAVYSNCDMATIAWMTDGPISGCRGFALEREVRGKPGDAKSGFIDTWVGFKGGNHKPGESQPSTVWPVQRYLWSDYAVSFGQQVRYRVIPMVRSAGKLAKANQNQWSSWSRWVTIGTEQTKGFPAYFNRGIVPAQFMARQIGGQGKFQQMLKTDITAPKSNIRKFLSGTLRVQLLDLLESAKSSGVQVYAALYELNDPELMDALKGIGAKCNLLLGSGAFKSANKKKKTPAVPDENKVSREEMKNSKVHVFDRLVKGAHFAHNKFVVFCDKRGKAASVWTGSTNWTVTGLCTQTNNGILIKDAKIAAAYLARWKALRDAGAGYPKSLAMAGSKPAVDSLSGASIRAWNVPCLKFVDLKDAKRYIAAAKQGVLYLMFNPGTGDGKKREKSLIQDILALNEKKLLIHGVLNQDPGGKKDPLITLTHKGKTLPSMNLPAILPKTLEAAGRKWFKSEFQFNMVMIHSKVIVIDPLGSTPVVMTGSHNMGPKASQSNDDNMVIIANAPGLAAEYAVYIMNVYGHYRWLFNEYLRSKRGPKDAKAKLSPQYDGNDDNDTWQTRYLKGPNKIEMNFWLDGARKAGAQNRAASQKRRAKA